MKEVLIIIIFFLVTLILIHNLLEYKTVKDAMVALDDEQLKNVCYLSFDDGPSHNTSKILDILKKYDVKATFFLIGSEIEDEDSEILERMKEEGHCIGLHSNVHTFEKLYQGVENCFSDYIEEFERLKSEFGVETKLFRFPGGSACTYMNDQREEYIRRMQENGFRCYDWHVSGEDAVGNPTVHSVQKKVLDNVFDYKQPIILLHDSRISNVTVEALPGIIERLKESHYEFQTLEVREEYIFRWK